MKKLNFLIIIILFCVTTQAKTNEYDLKSFPNGKTPQEIGTRIAEKFLKTGHSSNGITRSNNGWKILYNAVL